MKKVNEKKTFNVLDGETIDDCLTRMRREGYYPVRRIEKPIFKEIIGIHSVKYEPVGRQITFEGKKLKKSERL